jgi:hypothetical protein
MRAELFWRCSTIESVSYYGIVLFCMSTTESLPSRESGELKYDSSYIARLITYSYFFSQGNARFQRPILHYLATQFSERFDKATVMDAVAPASKMVFAIRHKYHLHRRITDIMGNIDTVPEEDVPQDVNAFAEDLIGYLDSGVEANEEELDITYLCEETIDRDIHQLGLGENAKYTDRGRSSSTSSSPYADSHLSLWVYFGLMGQTTGMEEYDRMFKEMVSAYRTTSRNSDFHTKKTQLLTEYQLQHHPEQFELLPDEFKI